MGTRSSPHEHFVRVKTHIGLERFEVLSFSKDFLEFLEITELLEVASNLLKIRQRVGYEQAIIAAIKFASKRVWVYSNLKLGHHLVKFPNP